MVTAEEIPASYEDILEMDTEDVSVSGTETYADHTRYYGVPDEEIVSCDLGTASKPREEDDADEEAEIPAAVMDEDGEAVTEPDTEPDDADEIPYYGEPDEEPSRLEDLTGEELEVKLQSVEIYASNTEKAGEPDDLTGFSFDIMN